MELRNYMEDPTSYIISKLQPGPSLRALIGDSSRQPIGNNINRHSNSFETLAPLMTCNSSCMSLKVIDDQGEASHTIDIDKPIPGSQLALRRSSKVGHSKLLIPLRDPTLHIILKLQPSQPRRLTKGQLASWDWFVDVIQHSNSFEALGSLITYNECYMLHAM